MPLLPSKSTCCFHDFLSRHEENRNSAAELGPLPATSVSWRKGAEEANQVLILPTLALAHTLCSKLTLGIECRQPSQQLPGPLVSQGATQEYL